MGWTEMDDTAMKPSESTIGSVAKSTRASRPRFEGGEDNELSARPSLGLCG